MIYLGFARPFLQVPRLDHAVEIVTAILVHGRECPYSHVLLDLVARSGSERTVLLHIRLLTGFVLRRRRGHGLRIGRM